MTKIINRLIPLQKKPYLIAEVGSNHLGDPKLCISSIKQAKKAGADCVKFQLFDETNLVNQTEFDPEDQEVVSQIQQLLDTKIKPAVAQDGGDVEFNRFHDGVVYLTLQGSCVGCPSSTMTLKSGIENLLKHYVREVKSVEQQV